MILDRLTSAENYLNIHARMQAAVEYVRSHDLKSLPDGRFIIDGENLKAILATNAAKTREQCPLEAHRRYIDLQCILEGKEEIGWRHLAECREPRADYDSERDIIFFSDPALSWVTLTPGMFVIFFPHDAHAPGASEGSVRKLVLKIAV